MNRELLLWAPAAGRSGTIWLLLLVSFLWAWPVVAQEDLRDTIQAADGQRIWRDVHEFASERYGGRATGTEEMMEASAFVRERFVSVGLSPAVGDTAFYQTYSVDYNEILISAHLLATAGSDTTRLQLLQDFMPHMYSGSGRFVDAPLAVADSSVASVSLPDLSGQVILYVPPVVYPSEPGLNAFDERRLRVEHLFDVAEHLASAGASAMLVEGIMYGQIGTRSASLPIIVVTGEAVAEMLEAASEDTLRLSGRVEAEHHREQEAVNVVGKIEGSDPERSDEVVIVSAHTDHVGTIAGQIFYGAHDNASGTAVMIEVARLFREAAVRGMHPSRTVVFAGFSGEEMGLLGSRHYVENDPLHPLDSTVALLNLDILGGGSGYMMVGAINYPHYHRVVEEINEEYFQHEIRRRDNAPNSDHFFFGHYGVPAAFFYGLEGPPVGIHTPTDVPEKMDPNFMEKAAQLAFATAWKLANLDAATAAQLREQAN